MNRVSILFLGLFLMASGLFVVERQKHLNSAAPIPDHAQTLIEVDDTLKTLPGVFRRLQKSSFFRAKVDGVKLSIFPSSILITVKSDELYRDGETGVNETGYSLLDQIGAALVPEMTDRYRLEIIGYADFESVKEKESVVMGQNAYVLSTARAEWILRYLESHFKIHLDERFRITGAGSVRSGKQFEFRVTEAEPSRM